LEICSASFAYPQHAGPTRAELARRLMRAPALDSGFVLSTCLRIEVVVPGPESRLEEALGELFGDLPEGVRPQTRRGERAVGHIYRIAAGLESPILGEQEVLTQFRQALLEAEEAGQVAGVFARLLEGAVGAGRQARELIPGSPHNSLAAVAAQAIGTVDRVAVLGAGIMAGAMVEGLLQLPAPPQVTVVARHPEKVAKNDLVRVLPFEEARRVLETFPAVVSATSAKQRPVADEVMAGILNGRTTPLLLVDMAMPPDFVPPEKAAVRYIDIDDLARMADRRARSDQADVFVESASATAYRQYRDHHEIGPLIGSLMEHADSLVDEVVGRFSGKLAGTRDEGILRQAAHTVARTLLAGPISYLKQEERSAEAIDVIADAFGVDDE
jgi:glutamyl-tRNA reductase